MQPNGVKLSDKFVQEVITLAAAGNAAERKWWPKAYRTPLPTLIELLSSDSNPSHIRALADGLKRAGTTIAKVDTEKKLAADRRVICAAPQYLEKAGTPSTLADDCPSPTHGKQRSVTRGTEEIALPPKVEAPFTGLVFKVHYEAKSNIKYAFIRGLGMPRSLRDVHIGAEHFDQIAEQAMRTPWVPRNPRKIDGPVQVREILSLAA